MTSASRPAHRSHPTRRAGYWLAPLALAITVLTCLQPALGQARVFYVAVDGSDTTGDGTFEQPWATIDHALGVIPDQMSTVVVGDGTYAEPVRVARAFTTQTTLRAENTYSARLVVRGDSAVTVEGGANFNLTGFEITRPVDDDTAAPLVMVTDHLGAPARNVHVRSNVVHDLRRGHLIEVQSGTQAMLIESNVLYNPGDGASHVALDGVDGALVRENVFFSDFVGSGRPGDASASDLVVTNVEGLTDAVGGGLSREVIVDRNIFLGWQGGADHFFVRLGGSRVAHREVDGAQLESNLFLGHSRAPLTAPVGVLGARGVTLRANTVVGNLPGLAFAAEVDRRGDGPGNEDVTFYNNIWSDPSGTMGSLTIGDPAVTVGVISLNNLYWNGGRPIPDQVGILAVAGDPAAYVDDPRLPGQGDVVLPRWDPVRRVFTGGHATFRDAFVALSNYALTAAGSPAIDHADGDHIPLVDLLGRPRGAPDIGALEHRPRPTATPRPPGAGVAHLPFLGRGR